MDKDKKNVLGKLKLNQLRKSELEKREMNALKGGCTTSCSACSLCGGMSGYINVNSNATSDTGY
ncbi:TIGR04149 family rSAM-modified RiPP [Parabacteroides distasonis]|jgi:hypothetical protein|uniref:TIGR04149 family rSAM-modified RiPP n=1 Tax=Parabacteroides distasonis TaxID=823 RepID=UPI00189773A8|nr:TIGR04149 family rSAM-modified RiPP [Parabacteroides distasonis]MCE8898736.1 TIGR04149 family rSAM-modified RiPP [Parabacteroides distasonis]MDB9051529.1 TIGR04149 family rSAM-modified RiPP [Parabacteroides distasonis]MDB9061226.1 TIGR04149 family rSAM-modified RiPP [Parabacteroides distasonis]MDB9089554.1 TIGR04149 family rSAM-modified RiPP [Parabacteroides distasonis]